MTSRWTNQNFDSAGESSRKGKQNEKEIEVLLELDDHRIIIKSKRSQLLDKITQKATEITGQVVQVHTLCSGRKASSRGKLKRQPQFYFLQRYISEWRTYVNCDTTDQIKNRDWLRITAQSADSSLNSRSQLARSTMPEDSDPLKSPLSSMNGRKKEVSAELIISVTITIRLHIA